jgi:hypothetical protein
MSTPVSHHPLVVNTADGSCWTRRAVTSDGRGLYALAGSVAGVPDEVLVSLADLAELGIIGSAFALPVPVGTGLRSELDQAHDDVVGACLARWEEEQENARLRLALKSAQRRARRRLPHEREGLIFRLEQDNKQLHAFVEIANEAARVQREAWEGAQDELERLRARVDELLAERHTTNEALDDAVQALRADQAEPAKGPSAAESADKLTALFAPTQVLREEPDGCPRNVINGDVGGHFFKKGAFADSPTACIYCGTKRLTPSKDDATPRAQAMRALLDGQRAAVEDPHDGPLAHSYRVGRDLPETGGTK